MAAGAAGEAVYGAVEAPERAPRESAAALPRIVAVAWPYALVLAVGLFVLLPSLGEFGFWDPWEPKYAEAAREMIELDSYAVPYYRYEVRLTKPILVYWGILAGSAVFGLNEFGARFVGMCMALAAMCGACYAVSMVRGRLAGLVSALVLGTLPQFYFVSRQAMPDVYLFTTLGSSVLFFALGLHGPARRRNLHFVISYVCFALAVLAKGPMVAGAICFVTLAVYLVTVVDLKLLWQPGMRSESLRFVVATITSSFLFVVLGFLAFVFGTSSEWWGYNSEQRRDMRFIRQRLLDSFGRLHASEILLALISVGGLVAAVYLWRRRDAVSRGLLRTAHVVAAGILLVTTVVGLFGLALAAEPRLALASLLGACAALILLGSAVWRLVHRPEVRAVVQPWLRPIATQIALFVVVFLVVAGPWHVAIFFEQNEGYLTDFIVKHNIGRAFDEINSSGVSDFYLRTLTWGYFPWSAFIPIALASLVAWWDRDALRRQRFEIFLLIASVVTFAAFTSSVTKFPHYLAPMLVPMAALIGMAIARTFDRLSTPASRLAWIVAAMLFMLPALDLIREGGVRYLVNSFTVKRWVPDELEPGRYVTVLLVSTAALMLAIALVRSRVLLGALLVVVALFANYQTGTFIPALSRHKTLKNLTDTYRSLRMPGDPIGFHGDMKHGIFFYTEHEVELLGDEAEFMEFMAPNRRVFAVMERTKYFKRRGPYQQRYPGHDLYLVDKSHFQYNLVSNFPISASK